MSNIEQRLLRFVVWCNWILFAVGSATSLVFFSGFFTKGVVYGGLIVTINFHLLHRSLKKSFQEGRTTSFQGVMGKYYLRLLAVGLVIFVLISRGLVHPLGLCAGLSIVVASIFLTTFLAAARIGPFAESSADDDDDEPDRVGLAYYAGLAVSVGLPIIAGLTLGRYLDTYVFDSPPLFTLSFLIFGVIVGFRNIAGVIKRIRRF